MAFLKYARADAVRTITSDNWDHNVRVAATRGVLSPNLVEQASEILKENFTPSRYLLSHATIVCSVDTLNTDNVKTGNIQDGNTRINRMYPGYRIDPECDKYINNNNDAWSRAVLGKSYRTFVGAHNFVEHVQVEDLSKGRIIDTVARDIGPSLYVDILIATDRDHMQLIRDIESNKMSTLSMGCSVDATICTKCGHVAADETEMCSHVRYHKGDRFYDEQGRMHRVAELCGHESMDPTGGVHFIEASWVRVPAFPGAVLRNILSPKDITPDMLKRAEEISRTPSKWFQGDDPIEGIIKAATLNAVATLTRNSFDFGDSGDDDDDNDGGGAKKSPFEDLEGKVLKMITKRVEKKVKEEMGDSNKGAPDHSTSNPPTGLNDSLQKTSVDTLQVYQMGLNTLARTASTQRGLIRRLAAYNIAFGLKVPQHIYEVSLRVGSTNGYRGSIKRYLQACRKVLGRQPSVGESKALIRVGKLLSIQDRNKGRS